MVMRLMVRIREHLDRRLDAINASFLGARTKLREMNRGLGAKGAMLRVALRMTILRLFNCSPGCFIFVVEHERRICW